MEAQYKGFPIILPLWYFLRLGILIFLPFDIGGTCMHASDAQPATAAANWSLIASAHGSFVLFSSFFL